MVFKIAQITPIHKKGSLRNKSNYRPASVLNNLSKVFENILYNWLLRFLKIEREPRITMGNMKTVSVSISTV